MHVKEPNEIVWQHRKKNSCSMLYCEIRVKTNYKSIKLQYCHIHWILQSVLFYARHERNLNFLAPFQKIQSMTKIEKLSSTTYWWTSIQWLNAKLAFIFDFRLIAVKKIIILYTECVCLSLHFWLLLMSVCYNWKIF